MEKEANQLYRRPQMTGQARDEEEVLVCKAVNNLAPVYLKELLYPYAPCRGLRSSENNLLVVPFTRSSVVQQCAFSAAGPRLWNSLPLSLRSASCLSVFKSHLKAYLFKEYYG